MTKVPMIAPGEGGYFVISQMTAKHHTCDGWRPANHPDGPSSGEPYWRPFAVEQSLERAMKHTCGSELISQHHYDDAMTIFESRRVEPQDVPGLASYSQWDARGPDDRGTQPAWLAAQLRRAGQ
ncbi:MAG: hypothetical protein GY767_17800 [Shimia sp.]|nr:hypothetical protein [Shimia sp.]